MTNTLINFDSYQLKFENSIFGKEKVFLDKEEVSSRYSITGTKHTFKIGDNAYSIISKYNMFDKSVIQLEIFKDNNFLKKEI